MRSTVFFLTCLVGLAPGTVHAIDKERLRKLAQIPTPVINLSIKYNEAYGFYLGWTRPDEMIEATALQRSLRGDASDAAAYYRLGKLCQSMLLFQEARNSYAKAAALFFQQISARPGDGWLRAQYADSWYQSAEKNRRAEAEPPLRQAVQLAPNDWRCWAALGAYLQHRVVELWNDDQPVRDPKARQAAIEKLLGESNQCYEKAVSLAPQNPEVYADRALARATLGWNRAHYRLRQREQVHVQAELFVYAESFSLECIADLQAVARLKPNDPQAIATAGLVEFLSFKMRQPPDAAGAGDSFGRLPEPTRQSLSQVRAALEKLTHATEPKLAGEAWETLGMLDAMIWADHACAAADFRKAIEADPSREVAWHMLLISITAQGGTKTQAEAFIRVCRDRLQVKDCVPYHLQLARVFETSGDINMARQEVLAALRVGPHDVDANLAQAVMILKHGEERTWPEASAYLMKAGEALKQGPTRLQQARYTALLGFNLALQGNIAEASARFKDAIGLDGGNGSLYEARDLLGP
jgi:tetratricopeptide (TPR) repeat protein